jgi:hypothetical protein
MKIKMFVGDSSYDLQKEINDWLMQNPNIEIKFITQSESNSADLNNIITQFNCQVTPMFMRDRIY